MSISNALIAGLRMADVLTFLTVHRCGGVSAAARELRVTPSQVSKSLVRLEELLGVELMARGPHGTALRDEGRRVVPQLEQMLALVEQLRAGDARDRVVTLAAPSSLAGAIVPGLVAGDPPFRIRALELDPAQLREHLASGLVDAAITLGEPPALRSWINQPLGRVEVGLFAAPATAARLGPGEITREQLATVRFVGQVRLDEQSLVPVDDGCPIGRRDRLPGHEATTLGLALTLGARSDQVVFGPVVAAHDLLARGELVRIPLGEAADAAELFLATNTERVTADERTVLVEACERAVAALGSAVEDRRLAVGTIPPGTH
jgi:DNA-binding transcriptional LysR family regulator